MRCAVITGTGRFFVAGTDITVMRDLSAANQAEMRRWIDVQRLIERAPKPVAAAMNGHALGGGAELSLACDVRILSSAATVGFPEIALGLFPGAVVTERARRLAAKPTAAIGLLKRVVDEGYGRPVEQALACEEAAVRELTRTSDAAEGLQAYPDKRAPTFTGR